MGFLKDLWARFRKNWIVNSFAIVGFFAVLAEIWPLLYLVSPWLAVATLLFYNNVITFFGGGVLVAAFIVGIVRVAKRFV